LVDVVVVGVVDFDDEELLEELPDFPPHPAIARVLARTASSVSMAVSVVLFMGRAPVVGLIRRGPP
jgi:hypothetical protein